MKLLVIGGAGYIGSHMTKMLVEKNHSVIVYDNLSTGYSDAIDTNAHFIEADLADKETLHSLLEEGFDGVFHFASSIQVGESTINPLLYYQNNVVNSLTLMNAMVSTKTNNLIFSSSAAVYGNPKSIPIIETHPCNPINPYGRTKYIIEQALQDYEKAYGLHSVSLRYFNAAGASSSGHIGERHNPETHLIPLVLKAASGKRDKISIFGTDYKTADGTCIRDYIHVDDLCDAHLAALLHLRSSNKSSMFNLGSGIGYSVKEIIEAAKSITKKTIPVDYMPRRSGDPDILIANYSAAKKTINWEPTRNELKEIISSAWKFETRHDA